MGVFVCLFFLFVCLFCLFVCLFVFKNVISGVIKYLLDELHRTRIKISSSRSGSVKDLEPNIVPFGSSTRSVSKVILMHSRLFAISVSFCQLSSLGNRSIVVKDWDTGKEVAKEQMQMDEK